jgi:hypothetical protein
MYPALRFKDPRFINVPVLGFRLTTLLIALIEVWSNIHKKMEKVGGNQERGEGRRRGRGDEGDEDLREL